MYMCMCLRTCVLVRVYVCIYNLLINCIIKFNYQI